MTTAHMGIITALVGLLKVDPPVAAGRVYPGRTRAIGVDSPTGVVVMLGRSASQLSAVQGGPTSWQTLVSIECYGRMEGGAPGDAADPIVEAVFARLASDPGLGGLAMDVAPLEGDTLQWDFDQLDTNLACITAKFVVQHQTTGRTLTQ